MSPTMSGLSGGLVAGADQRAGRGNDDGWEVEQYAIEALRAAASLRRGHVECSCCVLDWSQLPLF
jgi:hypothetical protein